MVGNDENALGTKRGSHDVSVLYAWNLCAGAIASSLRERLEITIMAPNPKSLEHARLSAWVGMIVRS